MSSFSLPYAELYDCMYGEKDYSHEVDFVRNLFQRSSAGKITRLLDFGCGTGGHSLKFASQGFQVFGVDKSEAMLQRAKTKAKSLRIHFGKTIPEGPFDAVISLFAVLNYLDSERELTETLRRFHDVLLPGSLFVADMWNGAAVPQLSADERSLSFKECDASWTRKSACRLDWLRQRMDVSYSFFRNDSTKPEFAETHYLHYYTPHEFVERAENVGFELLKILPSYRFEEPTLSDFNLLFVLKRGGV